MKLTTFIILISLMQVSASTFGQKMTLVERSVSIEKVLMEIRKQTGYDVLIIDTKFDLKKRIKADFNAAPLELVMDRIVSGTDFTYKIDEKNVVLKQKEGSFLDRVIDRFAAIDVRGRVVDENGNPLPGASVKVKGVDKVTKTDTKGEFYLQAVNDGAVLQISYVGYKTQELKALSNLGVIKMELGDSELDEVLVSGGYYTTTDRLKTGNISKVTSKDIENQPITSPLLALQGRIPGIDITPTSGAPGTSVKILIRGQNSIRNGALDPIDGNLPLYVVDGIPITSAPVTSGSMSLISSGFDPLSTINPANIESIEVLKDADATAIYGSRGANGVVLITTKQRGHSEKVNIDAGVYRGIGEVVKEVELLNTQQYLEMRREAINNDGGIAIDYYNDPLWGPYIYPDLLFWDTARYTNWQKTILRDQSDISDVNLNLSGGGKYTKFGIGGNYHKETLLYGNDFSYKRYSVNLNINHLSPDNRLNIALAGNYGVDDHNIFNSSALMSNVLTLAPNAPNLYNDDGSLNWSPQYGFSTWMNPASWVKETHTSGAYNLISNANISYQFFKSFRVKLNAGFSRYDQNESLLKPISSLDPGISPLEGSASQNSNQRTSWILEPQATFNHSNDYHSFDAILGLSVQQAISNSISLVGTGYTSDALLSTIGAARTLSSTSNNTQYRYGAVFGRLGYQFNRRYIINLTGRRDGSSRFGPDNRYGNFGAIGAAWLFSKEPLLKALSSVLSFGKLRISYGVTGNDQIGDSKYLKTYKSGTTTYDGEISLVPTALFNPNYAWEETKKFELGLEAGFFNDRISFEIAHYQNRSSNQLVQYQLPATAGFPSVLSNFNATVENNGWEFSVTSRNVLKRNFKWITSINFSKSENTLVEFPNIEQSPYATLFKVGEPLLIQRTYVWAGVDPVTGLHKFEDLNSDGTINHEDQRFTRNLTTRYFGGFVNTFNFGSFEFSFLFQFKDYIAISSKFPLPGINQNQPLSVLERWQKPGDLTNVQRFSTGGDADLAYSQWTQSDDALESISFIRLKTATLSYALPAGKLPQWKLQGLKIFAQGQNLFTHSNFSGWDPETLYGIPPLRIINIGMQLKF